MFSWGQDSHRGFRVKGNDDDTVAGGVHVSFHPGYVVRELAASHGARAFVSGDMEAFVVSGHGSEDGGTRKVKPKHVKSSEKIRAVSCGDETVVLVSEGRKLLCVDTDQTPLIPRTPEGLANKKIAQVACGSRHVVALSEDGQVYTWGQGSRGQLGVGQMELCTNQPQHLPSLSLIPLVQVAAGGEQSFALSVSGGVFGWGRNDCGQLGLGNRTDQHVPTSNDCLIMKKTVHISCGRNHTVILTKDGVVFTFGSGQYGQLGHNSLNDEVRPRLVAELLRTKVTKIACGWYCVVQGELYLPFFFLKKKKKTSINPTVGKFATLYHTLVMTEHSKLYSFGCNTHGQLGRGLESHPSVPLPVLLPQDACNGLVVRNIFSGGNCSFATCSSMKKVNKEASVNAAPQLHALIDKWVSQYDSNSPTTIKQEIQSTFRSASYLNQCFLDQRKDKHYGTSPKFSGLNLQLVREAFEKLAKKTGLLTEVVSAALRVLPSLDGSPAGVEGLRIFLLLTELLHVTHSCGNVAQWADLISQTAAAIQRLSDGHLQVIADWWYSQNPTIMQRHVQVWKIALNFGLTWIESFPYSPILKNILRILKCMYEVNSQTGRPRIPEKKFEMEIIQWVILNELFWCWNSQENEINGEDSIVFDYTFLMDLRSKKAAFDHYARFSKQQFTHCLELHLRRTALVDDAFAQLAAADPGDYKKPLMVFLDATTNQSLVYQKDFFHRLFDKLVSTNPKMFQFNDAETVAWFPTTATAEDRRAFHLFGVLCGLALYNQNFIQLPFPLALFKKLVNAKLTLDDMKEFQPSVGRSLGEVLNYDHDVLAALFLDFTIEWDGKTAELDPQNPGKEVTSQNRKEFVDAYVNHVFNTSVQDAFQEFERGFFQVCDRELVDLFRPEELQEFLVGKDVYDWNKLKQNTRYEFPLEADHLIIMKFWEVFDELNEDEKRDFVWFVTGCRKIPISGIQVTIRYQQIRSGSPDEYFPTTLTCHSILELPAYSKKKIMRNRLREALNSERVYYGSTSESEP